MTDAKSCYGNFTTRYAAPKTRSTSTTFRSTSTTFRSTATNTAER